MIAVASSLIISSLSLSLACVAPLLPSAPQLLLLLLPAFAAACTAPKLDLPLTFWDDVDDRTRDTVSPNAKGSTPAALRRFCPSTEAVGRWNLCAA